MTREDFLAVEDVFKPKVVYYAVAYAKAARLTSMGTSMMETPMTQTTQSGKAREQSIT